jgi:hypothetical protein
MAGTAVECHEETSCLFDHRCGHAKRKQNQKNIYQPPAGIGGNRHNSIGDARAQAASDPFPRECREENRQASYDQHRSPKVAAFFEDLRPNQSDDKTKCAEVGSRYTRPVEALGQHPFSTSRRIHDGWPPGPSISERCPCALHRDRTAWLGERTRTRRCLFKTCHLKCRPNSLEFRNIFVPETFRTGREVRITPRSRTRVRS